MKIKVGIKVKNIYNSDDNLEQYFSIHSFFTYFMNERFSFYRHLNDFIENNFYYDLPIIEVSSGKSQFRVIYKIDSNTPYIETKEIDECFDFEVPDIRNCNNCEYFDKKKKLCDQKKEFVSLIPEFCGFWSESD